MEPSALQPLFQTARVTVVPSLWEEPGALSVLESMAAGTPLVAYRKGGAAEYVRNADAGIVVEPDRAALVDGVRTLLDDCDLWETCSSNARRAAATTHSASTYVERLSRIYESACRGDPASASAARVPDLSSVSHCSIVRLPLQELRSDVSADGGDGGSSAAGLPTRWHTRPSRRRSSTLIPMTPGRLSGPPGLHVSMSGSLPKNSDEQRTFPACLAGRLRAGDLRWIRYGCGVPRPRRGGDDHVRLALAAARRARKRADRHGVEFVTIVADAEQLPFQDRAVDIVYVHDGLHHLEDPYIGLAEMCRVARIGVSVSEPARSLATRAAVRLGIADDVEDAGNVVARLDPNTVKSFLEERGFRVARCERYAMFYRHRPGGPNANPLAAGSLPARPTRTARREPPCRPVGQQARRRGSAPVSRILIWSPNYAPELIGIPPLVTDAAEWLAARGHEVDVVTAVPNYPERRIHPQYRGAIWQSATENGVRVHRSWLRVRPEERFVDKALYELSFATFSAPRVLARLRRADVVVCVMPSLLAASIAATVSRRTRLVLWVQDLVGLAAAAVADAPGRHGEHRELARAVRGRPGGQAARLQPRFRGALHGARHRARDDRDDPELGRYERDRHRARGRPTADRTRFLYSGNLGYTQGFETLAAAASAGR